ncbi:MAG: hypothetical protein Q9211_002284 [Gyalolechia sp. 1 TL-2023]
MWLLDTTTLQLVEFLPTNIPPYAILSHTWGDEEVSFQDLQKPASKWLEGYKKIEKCCALAQFEEYRYVWIDTCCIDKKSSAELSEAINSMFDWYKDSMVCYVYMSDVSINACDHGNRVHPFAESRWFRRGWTLQELLAPDHVQFYDHKWRHVGNLYQLSKQVSPITGIARPYLLHLQTFKTASVAARMSWASRRSTTRPEDEAYCLLGIFGINMPLLYGEGKRAFRRLQEEIARTSDDETLFAWIANSGDNTYPKIDVLSGIFAPDPLAFQGSGNIYRSIETERPPYFTTNRGLCIEIYHQGLPLVGLRGYFIDKMKSRGHQFCYFFLNCAQQGNEGTPFPIFLMSETDEHPHTRFARFHPESNLPNELSHNGIERRHSPKVVYIRPD